MKSIEVVARTVEEAIAEALRELQVERDDVEVTVLEEGNKGFLGILGSKQAKVRVEKKVPEYEVKLEKALEFLVSSSGIWVLIQPSLGRLMKRALTCVFRVTIWVS